MFLHIDLVFDYWMEVDGFHGLYHHHDSHHHDGDLLRDYYDFRHHVENDFDFGNYYFHDSDFGFFHDFGFADLPLALDGYSLLGDFDVAVDFGVDFVGDIYFEDLYWEEDVVGHHDFHPILGRHFFADRVAVVHQVVEIVFVVRVLEVAFFVLVPMGVSFVVQRVALFSAAVGFVGDYYEVALSLATMVVHLHGVFDSVAVVGFFVRQGLHHHQIADYVVYLFQWIAFLLFPSAASTH
jgi:hypothetical protein